jgi:hypothetical protein
LRGFIARNNSVEYTLTMKILILSPLFPPDTGAPASYVKELATTVAQKHETTLLIYGYLPEAVESVSIQAIDKRSSLPVRLFLFTKSLLAQKNYDLLLVNNAPSIELPLFFVLLFKRMSFVLIESDPRALKVSDRGWYGWLHTQIKKRAKKSIVLNDEASYRKAELLPFVTFDETRETKRKLWWHTHSQELLS